MRALLVTTAALVALSLCGCDINTGPPKTAKVECNCATPPPVAATPAPYLRGSADATPPEHVYRHRWYRHGTRYAGGGHSYYWRKEYSEISVATYDYHGGSRSYYQGDTGGSGASAYAYAGAGAYAGGGAYAGAGAHGGDGYHVVEHGWVDGYGHGHGGGATAGEPVHYETGGEDRGRMHPWHGYDADCPDNDPHHH